jgi:DNA-binding NarL/FixJ family response regulator
MSAVAGARAQTVPTASLGHGRGAGVPRPATASIRVLVAADDPLYQAGIEHVLRHAGVDVVARASGTDELARKARGHHPDVAVVDIGMPTGLTVEDRLATVRSIRAIDPRIAILILSELPDEQHALAVVADQPEGFGYLVKARIRDVEDFTSSVRRVARGGTAIDPIIIARLAGRRRTRDPIDDLTDREHEILALMAQGRSNRWIAEELVVTTAAVERRITSIFAKLDLKPNPDDHRRVLAILRYLGRRCDAAGGRQAGPEPRVVGSAAHRLSPAARILPQSGDGPSRIRPDLIAPASGLNTGA